MKKALDIQLRNLILKSVHLYFLVHLEKSISEDGQTHLSTKIVLASYISFAFTDRNIDKKLFTGFPFFEVCGTKNLICLFQLQIF